MPRDVSPAADPGWTAPREARLRRLRQDGATWAEIAGELGISLDMARERGRRLAAARPPQPARAPRPALPPREDPARPPLPPGDPRAWTLLTEGTVLAGLRWPGWA